jgi:hypothetical protein
LYLEYTNNVEVFTVSRGAAVYVWWRMCVTDYVGSCMWECVYVYV